MRVVADTGPLVAAANRRDRAHALSAAMVSELGRDLIIPGPVLVEVDQLLRVRVGAFAARQFLAAVSDGEHSVAFLTGHLLRSATAIDAQFADLDLGMADSTVMAYAQLHGLPVLTFDFEHFRAACPPDGYWRLVIDESRYRNECGD